MMVNNDTAIASAPAGSGAFVVMQVPVQKKKGLFQRHRAVSVVAALLALAGSVAPAQSIRVSPKNGGDSMLIQLLEPLVIDNVDDAYKIELAFSVNTVVTGKVKPMGEWNGGLGHKSFYDVSDGFYNIAIAGLSLAPVAYKDVPGTSIVSSIGRICDSGSEPFGRIPRARFRIR